MKEFLCSISFKYTFPNMRILPKGVMGKPSRQWLSGKSSLSIPLLIYSRGKVLLTYLFFFTLHWSQLRVGSRVSSCQIKEILLNYDIPSWPNFDQHSYNRHLCLKQSQKYWVSPLANVLYQHIGHNALKASIMKGLTFICGNFSVSLWSFSPFGGNSAPFHRAKCPQIQWHGCHW